MNKIEFELGGKSFSFALPSCWDELSGRELLDICRLSRQGMVREEFMTAAVLGLLPERARAVLLNFYSALAYAGQCAPTTGLREEFADMSTDIASQFVRLTDQMGWIAEPPTLTKNPFPVLKAGRRKYRGPKDALGNITYYDFALVDLLLRDITYAMQEERTADAETAKAKIMAVLWKSEGETYDEKRVEMRAKAFSKMPAEWKDAVYMFVAGSLRQIIASYPRIFSGGSSDEKAPEETYGHAELVLDLAGGKFGDIEKTQNTPLHTILLYLEHEARKAEKKQAQNV